MCLGKSIYTALHGDSRLEMLTIANPCLCTNTIADTANSSSWSDRSLWWSTLPMKGVELCSESGCGFLF